METLRDKLFVVTGGSGNLGRAMVLALAREGAQVAVVARGAEASESVAAAARELGAKALAVTADLARDDDAMRMAATVLESFGRLDGLVHCVGQSTRGLALDSSPEAFQQMMELNLFTAVRATAACAPAIIPRRGHIVHIGSLASKSAARWMGAYPASKAALGAYTQQLRLELAEQGVHGMLVCPGPIARDETRTYGALDHANLPEAARRPGAGVKTRAIAPEELAQRIVAGLKRRSPELVIPAKARLLFAVQQLLPSLGDRLVLRMTGGRGKAEG